MKNKDRLLDELNEQAPFLNKLKKGQDGYRVPADYFDGLEADVFRQLDAIGATRKPLASASRPSLWQVLQSLWQPRIALAFAGVLAIALSAWWYFQAADSTAGTAEFAAAKISADDAEAYLMANLMELDPQHIAMIMPEESLPTITIEAPATTDPGAQAAPIEFELSPEELDNLLLDMTDEELKELML
jgi:hypothetical protein